MRGLVVGLFCLILVLGAASPYAQADVRASKDAFLKVRAETVDALVKQIQSEPAVQKRFTKHFGKSGDELVTYFRANLVVQAMPSAQKMIVYGCNSKGVIYPRRMTIRKGYPMFCLADGTPILKARCGNPVRAELPAVVVAKAPEMPATEERVQEPEVVVEPEPEEQMVEVPAVIPDLAPIETVAPGFESGEIQYPAPIPVISDQTLIIPEVPGGGGTPFLFLLPAFALAGGGGGDHYVIPEPSTLAQFGIMGIGVVGIGWTRLRRKAK